MHITSLAAVGGGCRAKPAQRTVAAGLSPPVVARGGSDRGGGLPWRRRPPWLLGRRGGLDSPRRFGFRWVRTTRGMASATVDAFMVVSSDPDRVLPDLFRVDAAGPSGLAGGENYDGGPADRRVLVRRCRAKARSWFWPEPATMVSAGVTSLLRRCRGIVCSSSLPSLLRGKPQIRFPGSDDDGISGHNPLGGIVFGVGNGWRDLWYVGGDGGAASSSTESSAEMSSHA